MIIVDVNDFIAYCAIIRACRKKNVTSMKRDILNDFIIEFDDGDIVESSDIVDVMTYKHQHLVNSDGVWCYTLFPFYALLTNWTFREVNKWKTLHDQLEAL